MSKQEPLYEGRWGNGWHKEMQGKLHDGAIAHIYEGDDQLVEIEYFEFSGE